MLPFAIALMSTYNAAPRPAVERIPHAQVRLSGPVNARLRGAVKNWLIPLPATNPGILEMFRQRHQTPLHDLLPWSGEFAGKYLTSGTEALRLTGDRALRRTLDKFVKELLDCQAEDGYLGPFPKEQRLTGWAPNTWGSGGGTWDAWGHYHILLGLLSWDELTGDKQSLVAARKIGDLLCRHFLSGKRTVVSMGSPEMNLAIVHGLALLHKRTGEPQYLALAEKIVEQFSLPGAGNYLQGALEGKEFYELPNGASRWESLHSLLGLAELFWITGKRPYRTAFEHLYWSIAKTDRHNNGGFTSGESAKGNPYDFGAIETCCTIAWTAMGVDMLRLTGDPRVADELELSTLNQITALHAPNGAWCTYNTPMEGIRIPSTEEIAFQIRPGTEALNCCSVNSVRGFGMLADWALMESEKGLSVNYYGPSTLTASVRGIKVTIQQETTYPREGRVKLRVRPSRPTRFELSLRIPHWSRETTATINGREVTARPGTYLRLDREWQEGDEIILNLDMSLRLWVGERECEGRASLYRGPILYALQTPGAFPSYSPGWDYGFGNRVSKDPKAWVELAFEGDWVRWTAQRFDDAGIARVMVDGREIDRVDFYDKERGRPLVWERHGLGLGPHKLRIEATGQRNPASRDHWLNVIKLEPITPAPAMKLADLASARFRPDVRSVGTLEVSTDGAGKILLRDYASAGDDRVPYTTWFPLRGLAPTPFSRTNPSRSVFPAR